MAARARKPTNAEVVSVQQMLDGTADRPEVEREDEDEEELDSLNDAGVIGHEDNPRGDNLAAIMNVLEQIPDEDTNARVMVYRVRPEGGDAFLFEKTARDFASKDGGAAFILRQYGGGEYRIRVYRKVQQMGLNGLPFMRQAIAAIRKIYLEEPRVQEVEVRPDQNNLALAALTETMMRGQQETREMIAALANGMKEAITVIATRPEPQREPQKTTADILNEMLLMKKVMGLDNPQTKEPVSLAQQMKEILGLTREVREMVEDDTPPADEMTGLMKMGSQVLELIKANQQGQPIVLSPEQQKALIAQQQQQQQPARRVNPVPVPPPVKQLPPGTVLQPSQPAPSANIQEQIAQLNGGQDMLSMLSVAVHQLVGAAERNSDPYAYAVTLLDQVGAETLEKFLGAPDWFESLVAINPKVAENAEWFNELKVELTSVIQQEREDEAADLQEAGNGDKTGAANDSGPAQTGVPVPPKPDGN